MNFLSQTLSDAPFSSHVIKHALFLLLTVLHSSLAPSSNMSNNFRHNFKQLTTMMLSKMHQKKKFNGTYKSVNIKLRFSII